MSLPCHPREDLHPFAISAAFLFHVTRLYVALVCAMLKFCTLLMEGAFPGQQAHFLSFPRESLAEGSLVGVWVGERNEPDQEINSASLLNVTSLRLAIRKEFHKSCFAVPSFPFSTPDN